MVKASRVRRARPFAFAVIAMLLLAVLGLAWFTWNAARLLKRADVPAASDVVVVLAGRFERSMYAADLYRDGLAPRIGLSEAVADSSAAHLEKLGIRLPSAVDVDRRILAAKNVPPDAVEMLPGRSISTLEEASKIAERYGKPGVRILVVTSPSHALRARMILERALEGRGARLLVCATPYEALADKWWQHQSSARDVLLEWAKIIFFVAGGQFSGAAT